MLDGTTKALTNVRSVLGLKKKSFILTSWTNIVYLVRQKVALIK